jgi:hypothetical protein
MSHANHGRSQIGSVMRILDVTRSAVWTFGRIPTGSRFGLMVMGFGIVADLIAHLDPGLDHGHGTMTGPQVSAHLVVFLGMVVVLASVVIDGVRRGRHSRGTTTQGRQLDATR